MSDPTSRPDSPPEHSTTRALPLADVPNWTHEFDVVVVGHGGAGASAAIEAARSGAETAVLERMTRGGGTTALCTGVVYFGGGTRIQEACGFQDSVEEMTRYVGMAAGAQADPEKVRLFCEGSVEHFDWFCDLGVPFKESFVAGKTTHPFEDDGLYYSGNELVHPFVEHAQPAPRGHKPARPGEAGGFMMEFFLRASEEAGVRILNECRAERLVQDPDGRVVGVVAQGEGETLLIKARRGVILCAGGFAMNDAMLAEHAPTLLQCNWKAAAPGDDGLGILLGVGAGGATANMHEGLVINAFYPPSDHVKGILVDARGQRFVNEDAYVGRSSDAMLHKADGRAWLIVDDEIYGRTQAFHKKAAVEETYQDLERALGMPDGELVHTIEVYNRYAARGEDPYFHKAADYCRPLTAAPYAAIDCTAENSIYGVFTLGGLAVAPTAEVLDADGAVVAGLWAAGRNAAGLILEGRTYASGLSVGDATFFGRVAGRRAAATEPWS